VAAGDVPKIESTFDAARAAFDRIESLTLADQTSEYEFTRGRAQYLAFLIRIEDAAAQQYVARAIERVADIPGVQPYPAHYWHMSVKGAGFQVIKRSYEDDVLREDVPRIAAQAKELLRGQRAFEAQLGAIAGFPEVVFIEVHDGGRIRALNALLTEGLPQVPRYPIDAGVFLPHVSIARFTSNDGLGQLKQTIVQHRDDADGPTVLVRRIEFVKVWLSEEIPEFETLATYPLAAAR
jgi:2'-5' RNA ligase